MLKESTVKENSACLVCQTCLDKPSEYYINGDRRKGIEGDWRLLECDSCGAIQMNPMPTDIELAEYYSSYSVDEKVDLSERRGSRFPTLRKIYHWLTGDVDPRDFIKVREVDYGCGHAGYLTDFHNRGIDIVGADIAEYAVKDCQDAGYNVQKVEDFSHIPFESEEFDIVYLMQVFEHLRDPHGFMQELSRILKKDGELYLAIPNSASIWRKVFRSNWVSGWFAPFHLVHYNSEVMRVVAKKHGFEVVESWSRTPIHWFKLNLKAWLMPKSNRIDWDKSWLDNRLALELLMVFLRLIELPFREKDCLVVKLRKIKQ